MPSITPTPLAEPALGPPTMSTHAEHKHVCAMSQKASLSEGVPSARATPPATTTAAISTTAAPTPAPAASTASAPPTSTGAPTSNFRRLWQRWRRISGTSPACAARDVARWWPRALRRRFGEILFEPIQKEIYSFECTFPQDKARRSNLRRGQGGVNSLKITRSNALLM